MSSGEFLVKNIVASTSSETTNTSDPIPNGEVRLNSVNTVDSTNLVTSSHKISGEGGTTVTTDDSGNIIISSTNVSFNGEGVKKYSSTYVIASSPTSTEEATGLTNGNVYLNHIENGEVTSSHKIVGADHAAVTVDNEGKIIISRDYKDVYSKLVVTSSSSGTSDTKTTLNNGSVYMNLVHVSTGQPVSYHRIVGEGGTTVTTDDSGNIIITGSHYTSKNVISNSSKSLSNSSSSSGVYLNHVENDGVTSYHKILGAGGTKVSSDASGNVTITGSHYTSKNVITNTSGSTEDTDVSISNGNVYLNLVENGGVISNHCIKGSGGIVVTADSTGIVIALSSDATSGSQVRENNNVVAATSTSTSNGESTGNGVYLNHIENDEVTSSHMISGDGSIITVTADSNGDITINANISCDEENQKLYIG